MVKFAAAGFPLHALERGYIADPTWGCAELLEVLADPDHEEHESMLEWVGGAFDAEHFDLAAVNAALSYVAAR